MKITKYDVHVHAIDDLSKQIVGKYFYCLDESERTIKMAVFHSDDETLKPYINNPKYIIHMVYDQPLLPYESEVFRDAIKNDPDPCNFFMSRVKDKYEI